MKKHFKKHHFKFGGIVLAVSFGVILTSILWMVGVINLPAPWVYYSRQLSGVVHGYPKASVELKLKFHKQEHSLSCEPATLKMVLDYHGLNISESEILEKLPFDPTPRSGDVWGNPHLGFVGNIDGKMMVDGYGVYWESIALTASNWKKVRILKNGLAKDLVENILANRPVIVWGYIGRGKPVSWKTPDGEKINAVDGEHTRVVYGFRGLAENPDGFMVMDPIYGPQYWENSKFMRNWDGFGRMGVVVYP